MNKCAYHNASDPFIDSNREISETVNNSFTNVLGLKNNKPNNEKHLIKENKIKYLKTISSK
jgi:hypothetical protein